VVQGEPDTTGLAQQGPTQSARTDQARPLFGATPLGLIRPIGLQENLLESKPVLPKRRKGHFYMPTRSAPAPRRTPPRAAWAGPVRPLFLFFRLFFFSVFCFLFSFLFSRFIFLFNFENFEI
jgi:hypothetical protein